MIGEEKSEREKKKKKEGEIVSRELILRFVFLNGHQSGYTVT